MRDVAMVLNVIMLGMMLLLLMAVLAKEAWGFLQWLRARKGGPR